MQDKGGGIGNWEKHTKGIGLKLLQKFGFNGRLGAKENGVSRAIEVVVRPTNLGLGFGDNVEASSLKVNKQIEAEWRGIEFIDDEAEKKKSAIEKLASSKSWKKDKTSEKQQFKFSTDDFIKKCIDDQSDSSGKPQVIIDMRQKVTRIITDMNDLSSEAIVVEESESKIKPQLGQELLYNINLLANMEEMSVTKDSRLMIKETQRMQSFLSEKDNLEHVLQTESTRLARLKKIALILSRIDEKLTNSTIGEVSVTSLCSLFKTLHENFSEEFYIFGLINMLPYILQRIIVVDNWDPFEDYAFLCEMYDSLSPLISYFAEQAEQTQLAIQTSKAFYQVVEKKFLPVIRRKITSGWDVCNDNPEQCVKLMNSLQLVLPAAEFEQTLDMLILPKLTAAVNNWRPSLSPSIESTHISYIHTWLHPWLPLLTSKLSVLYPDIRRKIGYAFTNWQPRSSSSGNSSNDSVEDDDHVSNAHGSSIGDRATENAVNMLRPWIGVFDTASLEALLVRSVVPKLVHILRHSLVINPQQQDIAPMNWVLAWHGILPTSHMICLFAGEFFPRWLRVLYLWLTATTTANESDSNPQWQQRQPTADYEEITAWYSGWKSLFPEDLLSDAMIMHYFDIALDMMQTGLMMDYTTTESEIIAQNSATWVAYNKTLLQMESEGGGGNGNSNRGGYYTLIDQLKTRQRAKRRLAAIEQEENDAFTRSIEISSSYTMGGARPLSSVTTFKEVVAAFAVRNNIEFVPRTGKSFEGKQIWQFGRALCYIDQNVVFASTTAAGNSNNSSGGGTKRPFGIDSQQQLYGWTPVTLEDLLLMAS